MRFFTFLESSLNTFDLFHKDRQYDGTLIVSVLEKIKHRPFIVKTYDGSRIDVGPYLTSLNKRYRDIVLNSPGGKGTLLMSFTKVAIGIKSNGKEIPFWYDSVFNLSSIAIEERLKTE